jgi:hypothetical protein
MKIPKGADVQLKTNDGTVELHVTCAISTKAQANELIGCIRQVAGALDSEKRPHKAKVTTIQAA